MKKTSDNPAKILCVDDSPAMLSLFEKIVRDEHLEYFSASNGSDAIECAISKHPDLIFLDIVMLGMDGFAVMRELQKDARTAGIPVVFASSKNQKADHAWAKMQGAKGFITKPIDEQMVVEEIYKFVPRAVPARTPNPGTGSDSPTSADDTE